MTTNSFIANSAQTIAVSSLLSIPAGAGSPTYLVLNGLDRNEYTVGATGATGTLNGNGASAGFSAIGDDGRGVGIVFTLQTASGRYYNSTYGYFDQMSYTTSASLNDVTNLSLYGTNNRTLAINEANDAYGLDYYDAAGYLASATVATQPGFHGTVPSQATPASIASIAQTFVGQAWNLDGCWVLASTIAAEAGASLPVDSSMVGPSGHANGEWIVAFDGSKQSGNWQSMVRAGEIIVIGSATVGHITTCVSGSGSTAMLVDNITYVNSSGVVQNLAHDGSSNDVIVAAPHLASQEWNGINTALVKIYELDTPIISDLVSADKLALNARQVLAPLFSALDPGNKPITQYQVYNVAASDSLLVNGVSHAAHTAATAVTVSSLTSVSLQAGTAAVSDTIDVRAFNGSYWGDWQTLSVTVGGTGSIAATPAPPVVSQTAAQTWSQGQHVFFLLPGAAFSDPNGQKLSYTATLSNGQKLPSWLTFQSATETFSGTVPTGTASFGIKVTATDTSGLSASETISINIAPAAPLITHQTANQAWLDGQKVSFSLPANTFSDPQGQHLTLAAYQIAGNSVTSWLTFNPTTDTFSGLVPKTASGLIELEVRATNASGLSTNDMFYVALGTSAVPTVSAAHGVELDAGSDAQLAPVTLVGQAPVAAHDFGLHHAAY